ncbi:glycoside hydrolase family 105 protein [Hortaea werneckii]|nr:glycoside hydrolase family 105 protein [Hortaea werneckii]
MKLPHCLSSAFCLALVEGRFICSGNIHNESLALRMVESNIARSQGAGLTTASTGFIQLGIFQQALRAAINETPNSTQKSEWSAYLRNGITSSASSFLNASLNVELPLDRFSLGTSYFLQSEDEDDDTLNRAIEALEQSAVLQPRNDNGGLWYYNNVNHLSAYHNLSYLDGMFSYAPFAVLASNYASPNNTDLRLALGAENAWQQIELLADICQKPSGLLVHGYDPSFAHKWARSSKNGASPNVWGRSLAWYTLGLLNSLEVLSPDSHYYPKMKSLLNRVLLPQIEAAERSFNITGKYGVWQVVDEPGAGGNFIEASASCMTAYSFLRAVRVASLDGLCDESIAKRSTTTAVGIYENILESFLEVGSNGTLSLNGTSTVASLSGDVSYEYYVNRPTALNDLLGTSAFVSAGLEVERMFPEIGCQRYNLTAPFGP